VNALIERCSLNLVIRYPSVKVLKVIYSLKIVSDKLATYLTMRKRYELFF